jgi:hypothetical protein
MNTREVYENVLRDLRKVKAPNLHLEDFNYLLNKAIQQKCNAAYSVFETSQQWSDYLQALTRDTQFAFGAPLTVAGSIGAGTYIFTNGIPNIPNVPVNLSKYPKYGSLALRIPLPPDYWHLTGLSVSIQNLAPYKCYRAGYSASYTVKALTADHGGGTRDNAYLKISQDRPYYQISDGLMAATTTPDLLLFTGTSTKHAVESFTLDYLTMPEVYTLTLAQRDAPTAATSGAAVLQFPEYVCYEIINKIVELQLETTKDPRVNTFAPVNNTIPPFTGAPSK